MGLTAEELAEQHDYVLRSAKARDAEHATELAALRQRAERAEKQCEDFSAQYRIQGAQLATVTAERDRLDELLAGTKRHCTRVEEAYRNERDRVATARAGAFGEALAAVRKRILGVRSSDAIDATLDAAAEEIAVLAAASPAPPPAPPAPGSDEWYDAMGEHVEQHPIGGYGRTAPKSLAAPPPTPDVDRRSPREIGHEIANRLGHECSYHGELGWSHGWRCSAIVDALVADRMSRPESDVDRLRQLAREGADLVDRLDDANGFNVTDAIVAKLVAWARQAREAL